MDVDPTSMYCTLASCMMKGKGGEVPQMEGVVPAQPILLRGQQPVGLHHHQRVAGLHAEQEVVVVVVTADLRKLKRRVHHAPAHPIVKLQHPRNKPHTIDFQALIRYMLLLKSQLLACRVQIFVSGISFVPSLLM